MITDADLVLLGMDREDMSPILQDAISDLSGTDPSRQLLLLTLLCWNRSPCLSLNLYSQVGGCGGCRPGSYSHVQVRYYV